MAEWVKRRVFVTVRTYPSPSQKSIEVSCTAGVAEDGSWIRIFPLNYRALDRDQQFRRYQWIEATLSKAPNDKRVESYIVDSASLKITSPVSPSWRARFAMLEPLRAHCLCCLKREREKTGHPTLGFFRPKRITRFMIEPDPDGSSWTPEQLAKLRQDQPTLFGNRPATELEKVPFKFSYRFVCDEPECQGHDLMCADWELYEAYRQWQQKYKGDWEKYFRWKFEDEMMHKFDTHFYVGTMHYHPENWIIVGLLYPPRDLFLDNPQLSLF